MIEFFLRPHVARLLACMLTLWALQACTGETEGSLLASVRSQQQKKQVAAATIQAKKLLQKQPQSAEGRYLLGRALLESGDAR